MISDMQRNDTMELTKKISTTVNQDGITGLVWKTVKKAAGFLFYSTCSTWFECRMGKPEKLIIPDFQTEINMLEADKGNLIEWLLEHRSQYPWIYSEKEIMSAQLNNHQFLMLKHYQEIIGYVKIGFGPTYINDFARSITFDTETAFIYDTFILPEYRGKSLAVFMLNELTDNLRAQGIKRIICHIEKWNVPSIKSFSRAGFKEKMTIRLIRTIGISIYIKNGSRLISDIEKELGQSKTSS